MQQVSFTLPITITAQTPASIAATGGMGQSASIGTAFATVLSATVKDSLNQPIPNVLVTFALPGSGASATFAGGVVTAVTGSLGVAQSVVLTANNTTGTFAVTASVPSVAPATFSLTNTAGPAANVAVVSGTPQHAAAGSPYGAVLVAKVTDANNNPVSGAVVTFTVPGAGASASFGVSGNTAVTSGAGIATSNPLTANAAAGTFSVVASAPGAGTQASYVLTNTSGAVTTVAVSAGSPQNAGINSDFSQPLKAIVKDAGGFPVPGVLVTFTPPASGASGTFAGGLNTAISDASGIATSATFKANGTQGLYQVVASTPGAGTANFALTNGQGAPTSIAVLSGSPQSVIAGYTFGDELKVIVKDALNNPVGGAVVTFTAPASGPGGAFAGGVVTATTGPDGIATAALFRANSLAGTYQVNATVGALAPASFNLTNTVVSGNGPALAVNSLSIGKDLEDVLTVTLPGPAPDGLVLTLTSSNFARLRVASSNGLGVLGAASPLQVPTFPGLDSVIGLKAQALVGSGAAQIVVSAPGYTSAVVDVVFTPSGFVLAGPNGIGGAITVSQGGSAPLTVSSARLDGSGNFVAIQALRGGGARTVDITTSTPSVGGANPASVTIAAGESSAISSFAASGVTGATTITAVAPAGFTTPAGGKNALAVTSVTSGMTAENLTIGKNLQTSTRINLDSPVPGDPQDPNAFVFITITSNDPSKVIFSNLEGKQGSGSIQLKVPAGFNRTPPFYVQALASAGSVTYSATGNGYGSALGTVTLSPSGFVLISPTGRGTNFTVTTGAANQVLTVSSARLDAGLNFVEYQNVRGEFGVNIQVLSDSTVAGVITQSPINITGAAGSATTQFDPQAPGGSAITITTPAGFSTPTQGSGVAVIVKTPSMSMSNSLVVGKNLQGFATVFLGEAAPAGGLNVTLTSQSAQLTMSSAQEVVGTPQFILHINEGFTAGTFMVQVFGDTGTAGINLTAPGYTPANATVTMGPSGVIISSVLGFGTSVTTSLASGIKQPITIYTALLDSQTHAFLSTQPLAAGQNLVVTLSNGTPSVGTFPATATIAGGTGSATALFSPTATGFSLLGVTQPAGYTLPTQPIGSYTALTARVNP